MDAGRCCGCTIAVAADGCSPHQFTDPFDETPRPPSTLRINDEQIVLVAPAFLYAMAVVMWLSNDEDVEFARELAPVSFASLCVHLFAAGEVSERREERRKSAGRGGGGREEIGRKRRVKRF